jgi:hypothetical protein
MNIYQYIERTTSGQALARIQAMVCGWQMHPLAPVAAKPKTVFSDAKLAFAEVSLGCDALPHVVKDGGLRIKPTMTKRRK